MTNIVSPGEFGKLGADPTAPVSLAYMEQRMARLQEVVRKDLERLLVRMQQASIRFDALLRLMAYASSDAWKWTDVEPPALDLNAYFTYATKYGRESMPALIKIVKENASIEGRVEKAKLWNAAHADMPFLCDDLLMHELALDDEYHLVTPDECKAVEEFPATDFFRNEWVTLTLPQNRRYWLEKLNDKSSN